MFIFEFKSRLQFYSSRLFKNDIPLIWKITITGPFVTLYSTMKFGTIINKSENYSFIHPQFIEHIPAHGKNSLGGYVLEVIGDTHSHIILPCKKNLITELAELLKLLAKNSQADQRLISPELIVPCIDAYQHYLDTASSDDCKNNVANLVLKWVAPEIDKSLVRNVYEQEKIQKRRKNQEEIPSLESLHSKVKQCVASPSANTYELLRVECTQLFKKLSECSPSTSKKIINDVMISLPLSSAHLFNKFSNEHVNLVLGSVCFSFFWGLLLLNSLELQNLTIPYTFLFLLYVPNLAEKSYTAFSGLMQQGKRILLSVDDSVFPEDENESSCYMQPN